MTPLAYVGGSLTITADAVLLDEGRPELPYASIVEVSVFERPLAQGARLVVASPNIVLATDYLEAWMAHRARCVVLRAMNDRGIFTRRQMRRGEHLREKGDPR